MSKETIEKTESLLRIEQEYDETSDNGSNEVNGRDSMTVELSNAGIDEWINSDSPPAKAKTSIPDSRTTDESDIKKRKRGRRGGKRRGFDDEKKVQPGGVKSEKQMWLRRKGNLRNKVNKTQEVKKTDLLNRLPEGICIVKSGGHTDYHCTFCDCSLNSLASTKSHVGGFRHRKNVRMRDLEPRKKREASTANSELENSAAGKTSLRRLPDGILLIETGKYTGYHCAFCNCSLSHSSKIKDHVAGFRHQLIIEAKSRLAEQEKTGGNAEKSASENEKPKEGDKKIKAVPEKPKEKDNKTKAVPEKPKKEDNKIKAAKVKDVADEEKIGLPLNDVKDTTTKSSVPLKSSSLEDNLAASSEPVVGLNYVIEKQNQGEEPSYACGLCNVISDADDMKAHILGTRHRLMYMKITDPQKIAELMAKNLPKSERNKEIREYILSAMEKHGKGTIEIEISDTTTSKQLMAKSLPKVEEKKENIASNTDKHGKGATAMENKHGKGATAMETSNTSSSKAFPNCRK